ncbi:hypothetical protein K491DRAFT_699531 [Lophiostoma macrostomum CBS 122681]|uniref:Secreted protein n=1 Tax=Lophiostoma macrostomum CBS 122681 TaxID=1314788 RepID=A0A6A6SML4_9PLEO|nr:hypothetical protein K491DRAFT_699531 [Lophiostoma macrostomum CBS 122681]
MAITSVVGIVLAFLGALCLVRHTREERLTFQGAIQRHEPAASLTLGAGVPVIDSSRPSTVTRRYRTSGAQRDKDVHVTPDADGTRSEHGELLNKYAPVDIPRTLYTSRRGSKLL